MRGQAPFPVLFVFPGGDIIFIDELPDPLLQGRGQVKGPAVEDHQGHVHLRILHKGRDLVQGDIQGFVLWKAVDSRGDQGKGYAFTFQLPGDQQGLAVAGGQKLIFPVVPVDPDRPHRMDDILCLQAEGRCHSDLTGIDPADLSPLPQELLLSRGAIDRRVCPASVDRLRVGCIDDRVRADFCDVISDDLKGHTAASNLRKTPGLMVWNMPPDKLQRTGPEKPVNFREAGRQPLPAVLSSIIISPADFIYKKQPGKQRTEKRHPAGSSCLRNAVFSVVSPCRRQSSGAYGRQGA